MASPTTTARSALVCLCTGNCLVRLQSTDAASVPLATSMLPVCPVHVEHRTPGAWVSEGGPVAGGPLITGMAAKLVCFAGATVPATFVFVYIGPMLAPPAAVHTMDKHRHRAVTTPRSASLAISGHAWAGPDYASLTRIRKAKGDPGQDGGWAREPTHHQTPPDHHHLCHHRPPSPPLPPVAP